MNRVVVSDINHTKTKRASRIKKVLLRSMKELKLSQKEVHLTLINDAQMRKLNFQFRKKNKTTDVLSFDQDEFFGTYHFLGDILISLPQATKQAKLQNHPIKFELAMLSIHGLLHLLGYDHAVKRDEKIMFGIQNELLQKTKSFS
ncbi:MAG: rRNA maturation RNase YbeY [Bdellovibrionales bacterium]|nr:rRNA maturation RNase YbeY [Bdellovibrionales bacterium]